MNINFEQIKKKAFDNEMQKIAINISELRSATKKLRGNIVHGGGLMSRNISEMADEVVDKNIPLISRKSIAMETVNPSSHEYAIGNFGKRLIEATYKTQTGKKSSKSMHNLLNTAKRFPNNFMIMSGKKGGIGYLDTAGKKLPFLYKQPTDMMNKLNPKNKEVFNRVLLLHEGFEGKIKPENVAPINSHLSPEVLYREHNLIKSLPKRYLKARQVLEEFRKPEIGAINSLHKQFQYGSSDRLSRHAIKRLVKLDSKNNKLSK